MSNNTKDTIIGIIAFSLFAAVLMYGFVKDIDYTYERNIAIAEQARKAAEIEQEEVRELYISPADEFMIELMNNNE